MSRPLVLINSNVAKPPVSPVGLEYVGETLLRSGFAIEVVDLAMEADWKRALATGLSRDALAIGITLRNTDDCSFYSRKFFIPWVAELVNEIKKLNSAPVVLGGVGFSIFPESSLEKTGADFGIYGDGEDAIVRLAKALERKENPLSINNLVFRKKGRIVRNARRYVNFKEMPAFSRRIFDNSSYQREGAMVGLETKRGCPELCIYCADPVARGKALRLRPPDLVCEEIKSLLSLGVSWFHLCDSEFNLPLNHAKEICKALIKDGLGEKIRWYCYCAPFHFDQELARLMKRAGCAGINFGVDSLDESQLAGLGRRHGLKDIKELMKKLKEEKVNFIFDLLIGGAGETEETVRNTIEMAQQMEVPLVGMSIGVRLYPGTPLAESIKGESLRDGLFGNQLDDLLEPLFYVSPALGDNPSALVNYYVKDDRRFFLLAEPGGEGSYNYAGDQFLHDLILKGARGAYWDILGSAQHVKGR